MNTPIYYPPWFKNYRAYRAYIHALVTRKESAIRRRGQPRRRRVEVK